MKNRFGFTLVELMVVIVVISIIAGIAVVGFATQQKIARDNNVQTGAIQLAAALDGYYSDNGNYPVTCGIGSSSLLACSSLGNTYTAPITAPPSITPSTTVAQLQEIMPKIDVEFSHPKSSDDTVINQQVSGAISTKSYFLLSMDMVPGGTSVSLPPPEDPCPPFTICLPDVTTNGSNLALLASKTNSDIHVLAANTEPANGSVVFQNPTGGTFSCGFTLTGKNPAGSEDRRPHQYVIGVFGEADNAWEFYISPQAADKNVLNWNTATEPRCEADDVGKLKNASLS